MARTVVTPAMVVVILGVGANEVDRTVLVETDVVWTTEVEVTG